jgi:Polysaccharide lyase
MNEHAWQDGSNDAVDDREERPHMKSIARIGRLALIILLSVAAFRLEPAAAEILFKADFETGDFSQFGGKSKNVKPGHIEVVTDTVHSGKYAGRFTIHEDNVFNARQLRVQANGPKVTVKEGSDTFVSFYMFMKEPPKDRDNFFYWEGSPPPGYNNVMTWWVEPKADGSGTSIKYGTGNLGRKGVHWEADFTIGRWHQLGMHIHWSEDPARGNVKLWWDGVVVLDKKVQTKGPQSVYFSQPGIHRDPHTKSVDTIYFDDILCATTLEEIEIQKPNKAQSREPSRPARYEAIREVADPSSTTHCALPDRLEVGRQCPTASPSGGRPGLAAAPGVAKGDQETRDGLDHRRRLGGGDEGVDAHVVEEELNVGGAVEGEYR